MVRSLMSACIVLTSLSAGCSGPTSTAPPAAAIAPGATAPRGPEADVAPAPRAVPAAAGTDAGASATARAGRWVESRREGAPVAAWGAPASEAVLRLHCDEESGRIVLTREALALREDVGIITLEADGVRMDFPAERIPTPLGADLVTRIALDAPALDRLLATPRLAVITGDDTLQVDAPGPALRPVLEACRARH